MICIRAKELFSDYCDGSIDPAISVPFETHLDECSSCKTELTELRSVWLGINSMPILEAPSDFRAIVWKKIDAQANAEAAKTIKPWFKFSFKSYFKPALALGAFAIALFMLAPVVIPGNHTNAGLGLPWLGQSTAVKPVLNIAVGEPVIGNYEGKSWVNLPVNNTGSVPVSLNVDIQGTGVEKSAVHIDSPSGTNNMYHLTHVAPNLTTTLIVKTTWEQNGIVNSKVYKLKQ